LHLSAVEAFLPDYAANLMALLGGSPETARDEYYYRSPVTFAEEIAAPILLVVGKSRLLHEKLQTMGRRCILMEIEDAGHFFERFGFSGNRLDEVANAVVTWLRSLIPG
jgi:dipeptidyl aminopeptidase/acylaminoacyl peptidase